MSAAENSPRRPRRRLLVAAVAAVLVLVVGAVVVLGDDGSSTPDAAGVARAVQDGRVLTGPPRAAFTLRHPDTWTPLDRATLREAGSAPLAGLRRRGGSAVLTVTGRGPVRGGIGRLREELPETLGRRFDDFRLVTSREVRVEAGRALYTSWVREATGRVQSNLVVPMGNRQSFSVDVVIAGSERTAAAEVGAMLRTFDLPGR